MEGNRLLDCLESHQSLVHCDPGCKLTRKKKKTKLLHAAARSGSQNFVWNNILEFLTLPDVVKVLTILRKYKPSFMASSKLLSEVIHLSMLRRKIKVRAGDGQVSFSTSSGTGDVMMDTKLTKDSLKRLYKFAKLGIKSECQPSKTAQIHDNLCTFSHRTKKDRNTERWMKIELPVNQCSEDGCDRIVLWNCRTCNSLSSECREHVHTCDWCDRTICADCSVDECLCTDCGFCCVNCGEHCVAEHDPSFTCQGPRRGIPCPYVLGPMCGDCANEDDMNNISECVDCGRQACASCETMFYCDGCQSMSCKECGPHDEDDEDDDEDDYVCYECDEISPFVMYCYQVSTLLYSYLLVSSTSHLFFCTILYVLSCSVTRVAVCPARMPPFAVPMCSVINAIRLCLVSMLKPPHG